MQYSLPAIVVVDDSSEVRALIRTHLKLSGLFRVVGEAADGTEAIGLAHQHQPELLLLDMSMPTMDGLQALPGILAVSPGTKVVVFTGFEEQGLAREARHMGAAALVEKSASLDELVERLLGVLEAPAEASPDDDETAEPAPVLGQDPRLAVLTQGQERRVLDEHLERFREVFEEAAIGMATLTLTGGIVRANRALGHLVGRHHDELVGLDYATLMAGHGDLLDEGLRRANALGKDIVQVEHPISGDGSRRALATLAPVRDSSGQALYIFLQLRDITEQRAAEEELRRSEERFRLIVDAVEDYAIFMLDPEGIVVSWNAGAQRSKGYHAEEIIGRHFRTFYPAEVQESGHPERELEMAMRDGHYSEEGWRVRKDGSQFWANVLITAVFDDAGNHLGFSKVTRDVTPTREADEALRQSEELFRLLVDAVRDHAIFMLDPEGHVVSWNAGAERTKGYTAAEIIGQHFRVFYPQDQIEAGHPEHQLETALREGQYAEGGWRIRKDGSRLWADVAITAVFNDVGTHLGFANITRDTTDRRRAQQEREQATEALSDANDVLQSLNMRLRHSAADQSQFLAVTAHELRTPVAVLGGSADTLARHWDDLPESDRLTLLDGMTSSADRLRRLLSDLLTASRLDANSLRLSLEPTPVGPVIRNALSSLRSKHGDVEAEVTGQGDVQVLADPSRLSQVVDNLLENAVHHGQTPITVDIDTAGSLGRIRVADSGAGVRPDVRSRLFQRFATGDEVSGTGLGLFIVRELARAHGGDAVYEQPGEDSPAGAFILTIPLA
ncbi:MAG: hybrid sensor histidine kinase/response regulator [Aeromicrobium sp.]|nr:hybrid sensor histidine kinase/response regulator [Aeromicrobium sp.]